MERVNVYRNTEEDGPVYDGHFYPARAKLFPEDKEWVGDHHISVHTRSQWDHQALYHTSQGRWVLNCYSDRQGSLPTYEFVGDERARTWLLVNHDDGAVARYFGPLEEERGPGRPEIGQRIAVRLSDDKVRRLDLLARVRGISRPDLIRSYVDAGLEADEDMPTHIAIIGTRLDVVAGSLCDVSVVEAKGEPTFRGEEESVEYVTTDRVSLEAIETTYSAAPGTDMDGLTDQADEILRDHGYRRVGAWEWSDNAVYAEVVATADCDLSVAVPA